MVTFLLILILVALVVVIVVLLNRRKSAAKAPAAAPAAEPADPFGATTDLSGDPRALKPGDMVEYLGQKLFVRGSLHFKEGGFTWSEHFIDDTEGTKRWLSVEEDPDLEVVMWSEIDDEGLSPSSKTLTYDGVDYRRDEHGTAQFTSVGSTGVGERGQVEYVDFEGPDGKFLSFERFGGEGWEAGVGDRVPNGSLTIFPGS